ncbi:sulfur carrier protein ThiS [Saccharicrinis aurantiacus]|uniref:sulfur carrier protein ThiS n=1 Tax=Saccharicrinis aurantiacus TaxID=1849719 RepID=UPI00094FC0FA|nr:sulfur carrier protein ThiS [Saccharicrinis aurantiacus]
MVIFINDEKNNVSDGALLSDVITTLNLQTKGLAIAVNNAIVQQQNWQSTSLKENDEVLIISATKGG